jgi:hypothetical protein
LPAISTELAVQFGGVSPEAQSFNVEAESVVDAAAESFSTTFEVTAVLYGVVVESFCAVGAATTSSEMVEVDCCPPESSIR